MQCRRPRLDSWVRKIPWRRDRLPTPVFSGFPCDSAGKESACNAGDLGSISGLGRTTWEGEGYPVQYSGLENFMDYIVYGVAKSWTPLNNSHFHFHFLMKFHSFLPFYLPKDLFMTIWSMQHYYLQNWNYALSSYEIIRWCWGTRRLPWRLRW